MAFAPPTVIRCMNSAASLGQSRHVACASGYMSMRTSLRGLAQPRSSRMAMAYMRALAGASAATRARMNFLDLKAGDRRSVCHRTTATILPRAVLLALSATDESKCWSHPRLSALWNECLTTLSHTVEKLFFFARRVTLGSSIIRFIVIIVRCGPVVDRRPRWRVGKTRSGV